VVVASQVEAVWQDLEFKILPYKDLRDIYLLGGVDDVIAALDDSLVSINIILGSRFVGPIRDIVDAVYKRLVLLQVRRLRVTRVCFAAGIEHGRARHSSSLLRLCSSL
jgi:hypothetical protein